MLAGQPKVRGILRQVQIEFFCGRDWRGVGAEELTEMLDSYLVWCRDKRRKSGLGYMGPKQYRMSLGLIA